MTSSKINKAVFLSNLGYLLDSLSHIWISLGVKTVGNRVGQLGKHQIGPFRSGLTSLISLNSPFFCSNVLFAIPQLVLLESSINITYAVLEIKTCGLEMLQ